MAGPGFEYHVTGLQIPGIILAIMGVYTLLDAIGRTEDPWLGPRPTAEDRVKTLLAALSDSTKVIREIERELKARSALAERLQSDVARHEELLNLNREEVEAVAQTLRIEVRREGRRGFWLSIATHTVFFGLGIAAAFLIR
jgi:hypothetical protein